MKESNCDGEATRKIMIMSNESGVQPPTSSRGTEVTESTKKRMSVNEKLSSGYSDGTKNAHLFHFSGTPMNSILETSWMPIMTIMDQRS